MASWGLREERRTTTALLIPCKTPCMYLSVRARRATPRHDIRPHGLHSRWPSGLFRSSCTSSCAAVSAAGFGDAGNGAVQCAARGAVPVTRRIGKQPIHPANDGVAPIWRLAVIRELARRLYRCACSGRNGPRQDRHGYQATADETGVRDRQEECRHRQPSPRCQAPGDRDEQVLSHGEIVAQSARPGASPFVPSGPDRLSTVYGRIKGRDRPSSRRRSSFPVNTGSRFGARPVLRPPRA